MGTQMDPRICIDMRQLKGTDNTVMNGKSCTCRFCSELANPQVLIAKSLSKGFIEFVKVAI